MRTTCLRLAGLLLLVIVTCLPAVAQLQTAWWYLDQGRYLDFRTDPPTYFDTPNNSGDFIFSTSMCDAQGNLLFYGDIMRAVDSARIPMPGSVPHLTEPLVSRIVGQVLAVETDSPNQYLYIMADAVVNENVHRWQVRTAIIDMTLRGGLGDPRPPNQIVIETIEFSVFAGVYSVKQTSFGWS